MPMVEIIVPLFMLAGSLLPRVVSAPIYEANGLVCYKCPPGTFVSEHCTTNFTNSTCSPCQNHQFMNVTNKEGHCFFCKSGCPNNGVVIQKCTRTKNLECLCRPGFHRYPLDEIDDHWKCHPHRDCDDGFGVRIYGNHSQDTECEKCEEGVEFVNKSDPQRPVCQKCSECAGGSYPWSGCVGSQDTVCKDNSTDHVTTTAAAADPQEGSGSLTDGEIAVIVIAVIVLGISIGIGVFWHKRRRFMNERQSSNHRDPERPETQSATDGTDTNGEDVPLVPQDWDLKFIENKVFPTLSQNLGEEWQLFITQLPGWPADCNVATVIYHKREEEITVANQIMGCLMEWKRKAEPAFFTKKNIIQTLEAVENRALVDKLSTLAAAHLGTPNGSSS